MHTFGYLAYITASPAWVQKNIDIVRNVNANLY